MVHLHPMLIVAPSAVTQTYSCGTPTATNKFRWLQTPFMYNYGVVIFLQVSYKI